MSNATAGMGAVLNRGGSAVAEIQSISANITTGEAEVTHLGSTNRMEEYIPTKTGAEISVDFNFLPGAADHEADILNRIQDFDGGSGNAGPEAWTIVFTNAAITWVFSGFWKALTINNARDGALTGSGTLRVTGTIDWSQ